MRLDYSVPNFQLLIGDFDATDYLDSISLSQPIHEITQVLTWSGRFAVSFNRKAISTGLTEDEFDQGLRPGRWRPNQVQVRLKIKGYTLPVLRIDRYAYNAQTGIGEGTLHQILDAVATDRPAVDPPLQVGGVRTGVRTAGVLSPVSVDAAVIGLLNAAFYRCSVNPPKYGRNMPGLLYGEVSTRNPVADAQRLAGVYWNWLIVDKDEAIRVVNGDPLIEPLLFSRSLQQLEWEPDIDHLNFAAEAVIVTGSCQRPAPIPCDQNPVAPDLSLDRKGRPKFQRVEEQQPLNKIFTRGAQGELSPGISEIKWIFYQYPDDLNWDSQLQQFMPTNLLYERDAAPKSDRNGPIDQPCQTVTVYEQPLGRVFSDQGTANNLVVAALEMQSEKRKGRWVPYGVLDSKNQKGNLNLGLERYEDLKTGVTYPGQADHAGTINPATGKAQCLEPVPKKEERQLLATTPLETVPIKGSAAVAPAGWTPICRRELSLEVGFLPGVGTANELARQIANREAWRRDSVKVVMPIPIEWLAAGCPALRRAYLHNGQWQIDGLILSMQAGEAKFAFTAARIDREGLSVARQIENLSFGFIFEAEVSLELSPLAIGEFIVEAEVTIQSAAQIDSAFIVEAEVSTIAITVLPAALATGAFIAEASVVLSAPLTIDPLWSSVLVSLPLDTASGLLDVKNSLAVLATGTVASTAILDPSGNNSGVRAFNGSEFISFASNQALVLPGDFAIEVFLYLTAYTAPQALWGLMDTRTALAPQPFQLYAYNDGKVGLYDPGSVESVAGVLPLNQWHYLNLNKQGSTVKLEVNGVTVLSLGSFGSYNLAASSRLGAILNAGYGGVTGYMSAFRVTNAYRSGASAPITPYPTI